jgi:cephalosporin hydroxylase
MKLTYDDQAGTVTVDDGGPVRTHALDTPEAFEAMSRAWLRAGWDTKYVYSFAWFGRPVIQLPEDMIRIQEVIWDQQPDVIVETGVAHGGSLVFYATLFEAMGNGRVIGVELALRAHNRSAIQSHPLAKRIEIVDGSSTAPETVATVRNRIGPGEKVMVILDSNHSRAHVLDELRAYAPLVGPGSCLVATDGIMGEVVGAPRTSPGWRDDNPTQAALDFVRENSEFEIYEPVWPFNEGVVRQRVTYWPGAFIRRKA